VDVEKLRLVYEALRALGGRGGTREVASLLGMSERQVRRYIAALVGAGYAEPVRRGMRVFYRVARPATEADLRGLAEGLAEGGVEEGEAEVYRLARAIDNLVSESGAAADLVGAAKIHLLVPSHERITHGVDVLVVGEHARLLVSLIKHALGLVEAGGGEMDYRLRHPLRAIEVRVVVDGFREDGRLIWNLSHILRRGRLWLEHAVVAKLSRRGFRDVDAYDVAVSLPHIEPRRFASVLGDLGAQSPGLVERVWEHLSAVEDYIRNEFAGEEAEVYLLALRRLGELGQGGGSQARRETLRN